MRRTQDDLFVVSGASGFIGSKVVESLLLLGFRRIRALVRPGSDLRRIERLREAFPEVRVDLCEGNLLSAQYCSKAVENAAVVVHCAAGMAHKSYAEMYLNSVVTTRNLLDAAASCAALSRFVSISSFAVYSNLDLPKGSLLDETSPLETDPTGRHDPYCFAKLAQEELVWEYARERSLPVVVMRPGAVYGPGGDPISSRVGIGTFGVFIRVGGSHAIPLAYVDNCADAIALAGVVEGVDGEVFNVVDDDLPSGREFLRMYKQRVRDVRSIYIPFGAFYLLSCLWEEYSHRSEGQLPPVFNRRKSAANWKGNKYSNEKMKKLLGWHQRVPTREGLSRHFDYLRSKEVSRA